MSQRRRDYIKLKCADLIASDRQKHGRDPEYHQNIRNEYDACERAVINMFRSINHTLDKLL